MKHTEMVSVWELIYPESGGFGTADRFTVGAIKWLSTKRKISISWNDGWVIQGQPGIKCGYVAGDERLIDALCGAIYAELESADSCQFAEK